jgi:hypothetical protein
LLKIFKIDISRTFCDEGSGPGGTQEKPQQKEIMNWQKFFTAFIAAFIFLFVFGFLWYGTLMQGVHQEVSTLLRTKPDYPWLILVTSSWRSFSPCFVSASFQLAALAPARYWGFWWGWCMQGHI